MKDFNNIGIRELKDTNEKLNNTLLEDSRDFLSGFGNTQDSKTIENISKDVEYLLPLAEEFEEKDFSSKQNKHKTVFRALIIELILTLCFGAIGIPAIFRKEKRYGFIMMFISAFSLFIFLRFGFWFLLLIAGFLYFWEIALSVSRIVFFLRGNKYFKKFKSNFECDDNFSFSEL